MCVTRTDAKNEWLFLSLDCLSLLNDTQMQSETKSHQNPSKSEDIHKNISDHQSKVSPLFNSRLLQDINAIK